MALSSATGSFNVIHRDPWQHGQRDGLDFEPKVVIFWWNGRTASTDGIGRGNHYRGTSWATGASSRAMPQAEQSDDTIGQSNARNHGHRRHQIQTRSLIR